MRVRSHGCTDTGRRRAHNEDTFREDPGLGLYIVCDGVGGRARGEIASKETSDLIWDWVKRELPRLREIPRGEARQSEQLAMIRSAIQNACYMVHGMGELNPDQRGMSTTASVLLLDEDIAIIGQVGDSRVYRARADEILQLTEDHTLVALQLKSGLITEEQAKTSRMKNMITRSIGKKDHVDVDVRSFDLCPGDRFLLCSDGLHEYLDGGAQTLTKLFGFDVEEGARQAIQLANEGGGKDNITALFIQCYE